MTVTNPAQDLDFYCEAFGRAVINEDWTQEVRLDVCLGLAQKLMGLKDEASLSNSFERRVAGIAKLIPQTEAFADVRNTLALQAA